MNGRLPSPGELDHIARRLKHATGNMAFEKVSQITLAIAIVTMVHGLLEALNRKAADKDRSR